MEENGIELVLKLIRYYYFLKRNQCLNTLDLMGRFFCISTWMKIIRELESKYRCWDICLIHRKCCMNIWRHFTNKQMDRELDGKVAETCYFVLWMQDTSQFQCCFWLHCNELGKLWDSCGEFERFYGELIMPFNFVMMKHRSEIYLFVNDLENRNTGISCHFNEHFRRRFLNQVSINLPSKFTINFTNYPFPWYYC